MTRTRKIEWGLVAGQAVLLALSVLFAIWLEGWLPDPDARPTWALAQQK